MNLACLKCIMLLHFFVASCTLLCCTVFKSWGVIEASLSRSLPLVKDTKQHLCGRAMVFTLSSQLLALVQTCPAASFHDPKLWRVFHGGCGGGELFKESCISEQSAIVWKPPPCYLSVWKPKRRLSFSGRIAGPLHAGLRFVGGAGFSIMRVRWTCRLCLALKWTQKPPFSYAGDDGFGLDP